ncbi:N-acetylmuramoyl-L-alanine amidase [bacterium A37T11]|nr:N-acetylmuramoyl-L-alanine amidase [bacterium A37T11]
MKKLFAFLWSILAFVKLEAQTGASIRIVYPIKEHSIVREPLVYIQGVAHPGGVLTINGAPVKIYHTGAFSAPVSLSRGDNVVSIHLENGTEYVNKQLSIHYEKPAPPKPTDGFAIESVNVMPSGELWLQPGDRIQVAVKAIPGMEATFYKGIPLTEADEKEVGVKGIYRGEYIFTEKDSLSAGTIPVQLLNPLTKEHTVTVCKDKVTVLHNSYSLTGLVTGSSAHLEYGLGTDRLGSARMGFIDTLVKLEVSGKMQGRYRVRLADQVQAYIPIENLRLQEGIHFRPYSLTGNWNVFPDSGYDQLSIQLNERLPYAVTQQTDPNRLVMDVYGAVSNTNWIIQKQGLQIIKNVWYDQVAKDVFRVYIDLSKPELWGYDVGYKGTSLVIRVKHQPPVLKLSKLTIGVDAGHGGNNIGASGIMDINEKEITLAMALKLKKQLEKEGAEVAITRQNDTSFNNADRARWMKEQHPDILVSIHCNSSGPSAKGVSTYYHHIAYRKPSQAINTELIKLGLADYGNVGSFNFFFNAPTSYPSVLVETGFLSNPEDEERLLDSEFQNRIAKGIVKGLKNYLKQVDKADH